VYVRASIKSLTITKALAYYATEFITAVKSFMMHAPGWKDLSKTNALAYLSEELMTKKKAL
jgi:hypothetical protein